MHGASSQGVFNDHGKLVQHIFGEIIDEAGRDSEGEVNEENSCVPVERMQTMTLRRNDASQNLLWKL